MSKFNPLCRYFTHNPNAKLYIECRFTDEILSTISPDSNSILSTDKVEQVSFPVWDTELAWEVDHKTLQILRSQWAKLKLQCFSVSGNEKVEIVGYCMLDLRGAAERPGKEKWVTLKKRGQGLSSEIKIEFCILPNLSSPSTPQSGILENSDGNLTSDEIHDKKKSLITSENSDLYKIGSNGTEIFIFEITINFGANLQLLLQDSISFMTQQQFPELDLSTTLNNGYFFQYNIFESNFVSSKFYDLLHPSLKPETATFRIQTSLEDIKEFLIEEEKLIINLYHDNQTIGFAEIPLKGLFDSITGEPRSLDRVCPMYNLKRELPVSADVQTAKIGLFMSIRRETADSLSKDISERAKSYLLENVGQTLLHDLNNEHKYRVLIDLESIKLNNEIKNIYIRYSYPALGITNHRLTQELPNVEAGVDVKLTNGTSTVDVNMTPQRLQRYFENVPLLMEIWQNNESRNVQIGVSTLRLEEVFLSQNTVDEVNNADVKTFTTMVPIKSVGLATSREMGHLSVSIRLDDFELEKKVNEITNKTRPTLTKSHSASEFSEIFNDIIPLADDSETIESGKSLKSVKEKNVDDANHSSPPTSKFFTDIFQQAAEKMKFTQEILASNRKDVKRQGFGKLKVQQLIEIDRQLQQSILHFQTRDESLLRAEKDFERRWLELDRQYEQKIKETESRLQAEYAQKEKNSTQNNQTVMNLQAEVNNLKIQLDSTSLSQQHYESQWIRALQVLAGLHNVENENEDTIFSKGLQEMDQCWWQARKMAEEEMELLNYEKFELNILKDEINKLKAQ
ncbi:1787_t:CDS:2 [Diversispora eburnea]|uniref:1787_t:CDS:1 n=1 Tax=Diversispora eburnea TaxID=1213867 RepID=A0A9N8V3D9_9GLOM|nr:1787_t:CDS:2 [Diversispora eburnea]